MQPSGFRSIGVITGAHGLKGDVLLKPWDEEAPWLETLETILVTMPKGPLKMVILDARWHTGLVLLTLEGVTDRTAAEKLKGLDVQAMESDLPALEADEYYAENLVGLTVKSQDSGRDFGVVREVLSSTAGDYLEVKTEGLSEPVLIPFQDVFVPQIDMASRTVYIQGLDSLFQEPG